MLNQTQYVISLKITVFLQIQSNQSTEVSADSIPI